MIAVDAEGARVIAPRLRTGGIARRVVVALVSFFCFARIGAAQKVKRLNVIGVGGIVRLEKRASGGDVAVAHFGFRQ